MTLWGIHCVTFLRILVGANVSRFVHSCPTLSRSEFKIWILDVRAYFLCQLLSFQQKWNVTRSESHLFEVHMRLPFNNMTPHHGEISTYWHFHLSTSQHVDLSSLRTFKASSCLHSPNEYDATSFTLRSHNVEISTFRYFHVLKLRACVCDKKKQQKTVRWQYVDIVKSIDMFIPNWCHLTISKLPHRQASTVWPFKHLKFQTCESWSTQNLENLWLCPVACLKFQKMIYRARESFLFVCCCCGGKLQHVYSSIFAKFRDRRLFCSIISGPCIVQEP